jgi:glycosyltransferase involved in cell wall biosynthesis
VATPDLRRWAPGAIWVPNPYPLPQLVRAQNTGKPVVGHFPSNPSKKGTAFITEKVQEMQRSLDFEYRIVSGVTHREAVQLMAGCDIVIDQLTGYGAYGMVSVEAMALGCVVVSSVNPELFDRCPVIPVSSKSFEERLSEILVARPQWSELGNRGREYVGRVHNPRAAARTILDQYAKYVP